MMKSMLDRYMPILCALLSMPIFIVLVFVMIFVERHYGLHGLFLMGDIDAFVALLIVGTIVYAFGNMVMIRFEQSRRMTLFDHLRQSGLLYFGLTVLLVGMGYDSFLTSIVHSIGFGKMTPLLGIVIVWGIFVNAIFLWARPKISDEMRKKLIASLMLAFFFLLLLSLWTYYLTKQLEDRYHVLHPVPVPYMPSDPRSIKPAPR